MSGIGAAARGPAAVRDEAPSVAEFRSDVMAGLSAARRMVPCKYLYDNRGAELFERICDLDVYYPTRVERSILEEHGGAMACALGPRCNIVEFGSGSAVKTELLLRHLDRPVAYIPIDICRAQLVATAERLAARFPQLEVLPICADYNRVAALPPPASRPRRTVVFFPGSTIGNLEPSDAVAFLGRVRQLVGSGGAALIGADRQKDRALIERAYDDPEGVTAAFNLNLLRRINRELGANFDPSRFAHRAAYDGAAGRIEMQLVSTCDQIVRVPNHAAGHAGFAFRQGDHIVTERSYEYTVHGFAALAAAAGLRVARVWSDPDEWFSVYLLHP
ncbi:MAG TPA: L-histidine N(alpha)-methyltransferase [Longimicrobiales bacterium]|nr:L-histidine N(alpha)-methyltransferase [Longimicrobiales bacterium]